MSKPLDTVPITDRAQTIRTFDTNIRSPYVQNWNIGFQTSLTKTTSLQARYVGSKGTGLILGVVELRKHHQLQWKPHHHAGSAAELLTKR